MLSSIWELVGSGHIPIVVKGYLTARDMIELNMHSFGLALTLEFNFVWAKASVHFRKARTLCLFFPARIFIQELIRNKISLLSLLRP